MMGRFFVVNPCGEYLNPETSGKEDDNDLSIFLDDAAKKHIKVKSEVKRTDLVFREPALAGSIISN
jgi:hypothetical protein